MPAALANRPLLDENLIFVWDAFAALSGDRSEGGTPFLAIDRYAARYGIEDIDEFDLFASHIRAMDRALEDHMISKQNKADGKPR